MNGGHCRRCIVFAGLLLFPACSDSSGPNATTLNGVRFSYRGELNGRFQSAGPASNSADPRKSFAVAFVTAVGEVQLCAYQHRSEGTGNFLLLNAGVVTAPGTYSVPPGWNPGSTSYQPGTFLLGVDSTRSGTAYTSPFQQGQVEIQEVSATRVRGRFSVATDLADLDEGAFDVPVAEFAQLPILCS